MLVDGSLLLQRTAPEDAGRYTCTASNGLWQPPSASAFLTVLCKSPPQPLVGPGTADTKTLLGQLLGGVHPHRLWWGSNAPSAAMATPTTLFVLTDPAQVTTMLPETHLPKGMQGVIHCPTRANPPLLSVSWTRDGHPLELGKVLPPVPSPALPTLLSLSSSACAPLPQLPGWSMRADGSLVVAMGNDDVLGVYTCTPYNSYGTAGESQPTRVLLKVRPGLGTLPEPSLLPPCCAMPGAEPSPEQLSGLWMPAVGQGAQSSWGAAQTQPASTLPCPAAQVHHLLGRLPCCAGLCPVPPGTKPHTLPACPPQDPPTFTVRPKEEYFQEVGRELVIPCAARGDPPPTITWLKVGGIIPGNQLSPPGRKTSVVSL